jgi:hypothetical protein
MTPINCTPDTWMAMYREAETLSEEVLKVYPRDEAAEANAKAARNSMKFRSTGLFEEKPEVSCPLSSSCFSGYMHHMSSESRGRN